MVLHERLLKGGKDALVKVCEHVLSPEEKDLSLPSRPEIEVVRVLSGTGVCRLDASEIDAEEDDLFVFPGYAAHSFFAACPEFRFLQIRFDPRFLWDGSEGAYDFRCVSFFLHPTAGFFPRLSRAVSPQNFFSLMDQIGKCVAEQKPYCDLEVRAMLMHLTVLLLREFGTSERSYQVPGSSSVADVERGLRYINANFRENLTVDQIAAEAGMSKSYFMRQFRDLNGVSPWEYVLLKRIAYGTSLLRKTSCSVLEIAMRSGFNTKSSFNRAFRRIMGTAPADYRAAIEKERYGGSMLKKYHLAVDLGASNGRLILGGVEDGKILLEEVYRFDNNVVRRDGHLCWNYDQLFEHIVKGLRHCRDIGKIPETMAIDTWGVDYALLDEKDRLLGETYSYRDSRTVGMPEEFFKVMPEAELYERTGCQAQAINTLFQLYETKLHTPQIAEQTRTFLMLPEYLNFLLTGIKMNEYTNATTTNMVNCATGTWDDKILDLIGFSKEAFGPLHQPCREVGALKKEIADKVGFSCRVLLAASHDTAAAVLAVPTEKDNIVYISSGTWSILGTELPRANTSLEGFSAKFTNEGGCGGRIRYLRNINGMWLIQSVRRELDKKYSFDQLADMAKECADFPSSVDVTHPRFLAPESMIAEVKAYCRDSGQPVPSSVGEVMHGIYAGLSQAYGKYVRLLREITGREYDCIHIVGGGSRDEYLDELTAEVCGLPVRTGPTECSALGNILSQLICEGVFEDIRSARRAVAESFELKTYGGKTE